MTKTQPAFVQGSLFEENYLLRTLGPLANKADIALTEIVANAWDAGASQVNITIPDSADKQLIIEDNGTGLTKDEFLKRWMKLGYDRLKHQGPYVEFPSGNGNNSRLAYGRNGVGRHGLLCFNNFYTVITTKNGKKNTFKVSTLSESQPFVLQDQSEEDASGHGTRLEVLVQRNLPDPERILDVISARFLHDPQFVVTINGKSINLEDHCGLISSEKLCVDDAINLEILLIDTQKAARSTLYQGIAFWQTGRLVGEPTWILGNIPVVDGRIKFAKRYTFVVKTQDLAGYINPDWTGFINTPQIAHMYNAVSEHVRNEFKKIAKSQLSETKKALQKEFEEQYAALSPLGKYEVSEAIEHVIEANPTTTPEVLSVAVDAVINLEKTRSGKQLLQKMAKLSNDDIEELNRLLDEWTIKDALSVLDEIDKRISVIEAIEKLAGDSTIDELKVLHPLVTEARWIFGPEYDSSEYTSNRQLQTIAKKIFKYDDVQQIFNNPQKRPDLFVVGDSTHSITGAEEFNHETNLIEVRRMLIIELKKGGSSLTRANRDQAMRYVEDFQGCQEITGNPSIYAYVVGNTIGEKISAKQTVGDNGYVYVTTYAQLVDSARRRLFGLKSKLTERYDGISGIQLANKVVQLELDVAKK
ncbi:ATP-binding protein [Desulfovibrio sp. OttesenSCG-928-G11]|nr:ATP-binding protein [Desulfovibrio sp. OttesenSCG-928-G11]